MWSAAGRVFFMCYLELLFLFLGVKEVREVNLGVKEVREVNLGVKEVREVKEVKAVCFANHRRSSVSLDNTSQVSQL